MRCVWLLNDAAEVRPGAPGSPGGDLTGDEAGEGAPAIVLMLVAGGPSPRGARTLVGTGRPRKSRPSPAGGEGGVASTPN
eukprot:COSAG01_NODE_4976_length_4577_cov_4.889013_4_plen_80_part_00